MLFQKYFLIVTLLISNLFAFAQTKAVQQLEQKITQLNDVQNYEASVQLISDFIDDDSHSAAEKFYAYIFKSDRKSVV